MKKPVTGHKQGPQKIGLMGPFGYGNLGDAAIQEAMIQHVKQYFPDGDIYGFSLNPQDTEKRHGINSFPISRMDWGNPQEGEKGLWKRSMGWLRSHSNPSVRNLERWIQLAPIEFLLIIKAYQSLKGFNYFIVSGGGQLDDYWSSGPWATHTPCSNGGVWQNYARRNLCL